MDRYAKILSFQPETMRSLRMSMHKQTNRPLVVSRGPDQPEMTSHFQKSTDTAVVRNYSYLTV